MFALHSSGDGGDLVGFAEKADLEIGLEHQGRRGVVAGPRLVVEPLRRADGIRGLPRDLVGECQRCGKRIVCDARDQPEIANPRCRKRSGR